MYEIKKIQIWPFARSVAVIITSAMVVIPLGVIFFIAVMESQYGGFDIDDIFDVLFDEDFAIGYLAIIPISAAVSLAAATLGALAYNFVSQRLGGIVLEIDYHQNGLNSQDQESSVNQENK